MTLKTNFEHVNEYLELLNRLAEYLKAVPVAHSKKGRNMEDILFLDKNNRFFVEDFSYVFGNSRHTGVELVALWRKLDLPPMVKSDIDVLFRYNERLNAISSHVSDYRKQSMSHSILSKHSAGMWFLFLEDQKTRRDVGYSTVSLYCRSESQTVMKKNISYLLETGI